MVGGDLSFTLTFSLAHFHARPGTGCLPLANIEEPAPGEILKMQHGIHLLMKNANNKNISVTNSIEDGMFLKIMATNTGA